MSPFQTQKTAKLISDFPSGSNFGAVETSHGGNFEMAKLLKPNWRDRELGLLGKQASVNKQPVVISNDHEQTLVARD